jgi:hypothetical protein
MVSTRLALRNRWWTLAWAAGILWTAVSFAGGTGKSVVDPANAQDGNAGDASELLSGMQ